MVLKKYLKFSMEMQMLAIALLPTPLKLLKFSSFSKSSQPK